MGATRIRGTWALAALAIAAAAGQDQAQAGAKRELVVFLSPGSSSLDLAKRLEPRADMRVRVVLVIGDFRKAGAWIDDDSTREFFKTLEKAGLLKQGAALFDEEGLDLARKLGIARVPAVALLERGKAQVAYGAGVNLAEMLK